MRMIVRIEPEVLKAMKKIQYGKTLRNYRCDVEYVMASYPDRPMTTEEFKKKRYMEAHYG